jgi:hypothetical protein
MNVPRSAFHILDQEEPNAFLAIGKSGFISGTLDILTAVAVYVWILGKTTASKLLQGIASGVFGKKAFEGGTRMAISGLFLHYLIAFIFAISYFIVYPMFPPIKKNWVVSGLVYGMGVWVVMNLMVRPLVFPGTPIPSWDAIVLGMAILMVMIGLPVAYFTHDYYQKKNHIARNPANIHS